MDQALSERLSTWIRQKLANRVRGDVSFYEYMQACLYHPEFGYYQRPVPKIGREGDFYTSAAIGTVMGAMLARTIVDQSTHGQTFFVVEWGGGTGRLARQILDELRAEYPETYWRLRWVSLEQSAYHRELQKQELVVHADKIRYLTEMPQIEAPMIVLANELLDAFPVYRVKYERGEFREMRVRWHDARNQFVPVWSEIVSTRLRRELEQVQFPFRPGQMFELSPDIRTWVQDVCRVLKRGCIIVIDYGDVEEEVWASHRMHGTFLCYYRHRAHDDPFVRPGEQDMTAHVNFTTVIREAERSGMSVHFSTQKQFLLSAGVTDLLQDHTARDPFSRQSRVNRAVRQLLLSDSMSELFKVLTLHK